MVFKYKTIIILFLIVLLSLYCIGSANAEYPAASGPELAFIANNVGDSITIVDVATNQTVKQLFTAPGPRSVAVNPAGTYLFVACDRDSSISVYNLADFSLVSYIEVHGYAPKRIAITNSGDTAYILAAEQPISIITSKHYLLTVDIGTMNVIKIDSLNSNSVTDMALTGNSSHVVFSNGLNKTLTRYNTNTKVFDSYDIGAVRPSSSPPVALSTYHDQYASGMWVLCNDKAYNYDPYANILYDLYDPSVLIISNITLLGAGSKIDASMFGSSNIVYVNYPSNSPNVITKYSAPGIIRWNCTLPSSVYAMKVSNDGTKLYASEGGSQRVNVIDTATGNVLTTVSTGELPVAMAIGPVLSSLTTGQYVKINVKTLSYTLPLAELRVSVYDGAERLLYTGETDSTGSVTFYLNSLTRYGLHITNAYGIDYWEYITPSDTNYQINVPFEQVLGLESVTDQFLNTTAQGKVSYYTTGSLNTQTNVGTFNTFYEDTGLNTKSVNVSLYKNNSTIGGSPTLLSAKTYYLANTNNLISNSGFQSGDFTGWTAAPGAGGSLSVVTDTAFGSNYAAKHIKSGDANYLFTNKYTGISPGYTYTLNYNGKSLSTSGLTCVIRSYNSGDVQLADTASQEFSFTNSVAPYKLQGTTPANTAKIDLLVMQLADGTVWSGDYTLTSYSVTHAFTSNNAAGNGYYVKIEAVQNDGTTKTYYTPINFAGPTVVIPGFALEWYYWVALIPALFLFAAGTATKKGTIGLIGMVWAYIANYWNWYSLYVPQIVMYGIITLGLLISIAVIIYEAERYRS